MNLQQPHSIEQYYQSLTKNQQQTMSSSQSPNTQLLKKFNKLNRSIQHRLQHYCRLTSIYFQKIENSFLVTFSKVLEKMGNDLMQAEEAYKNINKEIMEKERCVNLNQDKLFFIQQSTYYRQQLEFKTKETQKLKQQSFLLIKENTGLKQKLFEKVQQNIFLKQKCKRLEKLNLLHQSQIEKIPNPQQTKPNQQQKEDLPSTAIKTSRSPDKNSRKWASLGRQTDQEKRQKEEEFNQQKQNLFVQIRKDLKTREKINLSSIINRSCIDQESNEGKNNQFRSRKKKMYVDLIKNGPMTPRLADIVQKSTEIKQKMESQQTVGSNFNVTFQNISLPLKRSLHTSQDKHMRGDK